MNLIDLKTLSAEMSLSIYTIRKFVRMGMPHFRVGKKILVNKKEVEPWFARHFRPDTDSNKDVLDKILDKALAEINQETND